MGEPSQYIKFMSDIIDSGVWATLSAGAKTLYPVLLKFSDQNFKHVWPSTSTLMKLSGFKTKKSVQEAKRDLIKSGLIQTVSGSGHSNSIYYFTFNYPGSKITPLWGKKVSHPGIDSHPSGEDRSIPRGDEFKSPNHINITITNNQVNKKEKEKQNNHNDLIDFYGEPIYLKAVEIAEKKGLQENFAYVKAICKNLLTDKNPTNINQEKTNVSWSSFLDWAGSHLTPSSVHVLREADVDFSDGNLIIYGQFSEFLSQVVKKYFSGSEVREVVFFDRDNRMCSK